MKTKVWRVKTGHPDHPAVVTSILNVRAASLQDAVINAENVERDACTQMAEDEGENVEPDKAIAVEFLCELDD